MNPIIYNDCQKLYYDKFVNWELLKCTTVLVTGAYGMLPSYMIWMLIYLNEYQQNYNITIVALCRNKEKAKKKFGHYCNKEYFILCLQDITEEIQIDIPIDLIIHGASPASAQYYNTNPVGVIIPNSIGTYYTLELARKNSTKGYLYFSSGEVYGAINKEEVFEDDYGYVDPLDTRSCYCESKRLGESLCKAYAHQYGLHTSIVRPSHTYGPTLDLENDHRVFAEFVFNIVRNEDICVKSDGLAVRNFCYIGDAISAYFKILLEGQSGEAYNVANRNAQVSIRELADILISIFPQLNLKVSFGKEPISYLEDKHKKHSVLSTKKLETLGWKPQYSIKEGFKRTIISFREDLNEKENQHCNSYI